MVGPANAPQISTMFKRFYSLPNDILPEEDGDDDMVEELAQDLSEKIGDEEIPMAHVQGHLLSHLLDPSGAVRNTDALLQAVKLDIRLRAEHDEAVRAGNGAVKCKDQ